MIGLAERCPFCSEPAPVVWVHGRGQCSFCGTDREPSCEGAPELPLGSGLPTLITERLVLRPGAVEPTARGYGMWRIFRAGRGELPVGEVALLPRGQDRQEVELSFRIDLMARGQGFAREAAQAVIDHGERRLGLDELVAFTDPDHRAPARILARLGFVADGRHALAEGEQLVVWRRRSGR